jgi:hypothetical protein
MVPAFSTDSLQAAAWIGTAVGAIVAAFKLWSELRLGRKQREQELRWKQAEAGKSLNDEMLEDPLAKAAMQMLDYAGTSFELPSGKQETIAISDLRVALDPKNKATGGKYLYIRQCFDSLFYYMATMEHYTACKLIISEDIAFPLEYYVPLLAKLRKVVDLYINEYHLDRVRLFLERYEDWKGSAPPKQE